MWTKILQGSRYRGSPMLTFGSENCTIELLYVWHQNHTMFKIIYVVNCQIVVKLIKARYRQVGTRITFPVVGSGQIALRSRVSNGAPKILFRHDPPPWQHSFFFFFFPFRDSCTGAAPGNAPDPSDMLFTPFSFPFRICLPLRSHVRSRITH